jgi:UDP-4-amino-4,6-dideoxy-L-N-acetyl-beta-L-altrosamine transaminase
MSTSYLPYAKQSIQEDDIQAVAKALKEEWITRGPLVEEFEKAIADYCQVPYAVAFNSGTAALMAAYFAARLTPFDRVISTPNTFIATVGAAVQLGIRPNLIDIDRSTGNIDISQLEPHLHFRLTRGRPFIVPVHFSGLAVDMAKLNRHICHPETIIIEDAAHALGSSYPSGEKVGSCPFSQMTIFSFHPAKTLTTGEGGMVTTQDPELYHRLQLFRNNGIERAAPYLSRPAALGYYEVHAITGNFNVTSFQAALGLSQLKRLDKFITKRKKLVQRYRQHLKEVPHLTLFTDQQDACTAFHLFVAQIDFKALGKSREKVMKALDEKGIGSQIHYIPLYHHPVFHCDIWSEKPKYPNMEIYYEQALSLPLYYDLTEKEVDRVCQELLSILQKP